MKNKPHKLLFNFRSPLFLYIIGGVVFALLVPMTYLLVFGIYYSDKVYPRVMFSNADLSGKSRSEVTSIVESIVSERLSHDLMVRIEDKDGVSLGPIKKYANYSVTKTVDGIFARGHSNKFATHIKDVIDAHKYIAHVDAVFSYDQQSLDSALSSAVSRYEKPVVNSVLTFKNGVVSLSPSQDGLVARRDGFIESFANYLALRGGSPEFTLPLEYTAAEISEKNSQQAVVSVNKALSRPLILKSNYLPGSVWNISPDQLYSFIDLKSSSGEVMAVVQDYKVASYSSQIAQTINRDAIDAKFQFADNKASVFEPAQPGLALDTVALTQEISKHAFDSSQPSDIEVPVQVTEPALSTENVNTYGIKELVAKGTSKFTGSPAGRIHNLALASSKLNGALIAPGETFSMYKIVGEVEQSTGYQDAFIIKDGRTVPGIGGGLCQVSTTLFRAALNAGLPIVERHQHAYRVYYYEQDSAAGIDAAVYFPSWDLKFVNNTGNYLLLQTKVDTKKMTAEFNLYGVKDGRKVEISKPILTNQTPPPPELRVDDPTLARGQEKEVDHAVWGADTVFGRKVFNADGTLSIDETFKSNYKAWQRVVMVGVKD